MRLCRPLRVLGPARERVEGSTPQDRALRAVLGASLAAIKARIPGNGRPRNGNEARARVMC